MGDELQSIVKELPKTPGVYFHKDKTGEIIYVGKAANLKNRVKQYFQNSRARDPKTDALVKEIANIDYMEVDSEIEALFLEAEMIRRYMPKYNILLRDDKALSYVRIDYDSDYPTVSTTRRPLDDGARYFGPYFSTLALRQALRLLRKIFPYAIKNSNNQKRAKLDYHLGLDPGLEENRTTLNEYRSNLRKLIAIIQGKKDKIVKQLEKEMKYAAKRQDFELAALLRNKVSALKSLDKQVIFSDKEFADISKDHALSELVKLLNLEKYPRRIEGFDVSHMQGSNVVASMVVFTNGVSDKANYRKFKTKANINNDFHNMNETINRRFSPKNLKNWGKPDLVLIDGGKGQLDASIKARDERGLNSLPFIGLAKREEQIILDKNRSNVLLNEKYLKKLNGFVRNSDGYITINLPLNTNLIKLLQRIRDESHRFAVSYHSLLKVKRQTISQLDTLPGIGPITRKKLIRSYGSISGINDATEDDLTGVVGSKKAKLLKTYFK